MIHNTLINSLITLAHKTLFPYKYQQQVFTYFIPSPPQRKTGYRERQFDSTINDIIKLGFKITKSSPQVLSTERSSGMWINFIIKASSYKATKIDIDALMESIELTMQEGQGEEIYTLELEQE